MFLAQHPTLTLGTYGRWPFHRTLRLPPSLLEKHKHIMGTTGQGKSKFAAHQATSLISQGIPCAVIDPHADLTGDILAMLYDSGYFQRENATQKLWYIEFCNPDRFLPFNVLRQPYGQKIIAENIFDAISRAWPSLGEGHAPRLENIIKAGVPVLIANNLPLTSLHDLLTNKAFRDQLLMAPTLDSEIIKFFMERYDQWDKRDAPAMIESTLTRVFLLSYTDPLRYCLGQLENRLNFRSLMDEGISVLFNLGQLDPNTRRLLGCLITVGFEQATLSRAAIPEQDRNPYHLFIDEFSQFTSQSAESVTTFLSEARKFKVALTLLHQTWSQLSRRLQGSMQNTMHIIFNLGREDALWASQIFGRFDPHKIKHEVPDTEVVDKTHPMFYNVQETFESVARDIEDLQPREALMKLHNRTIKFRSAYVPPPRCTLEQLHTLKEHYAQLLLTPLQQIPSCSPVPTVFTAPASPSQRKSRVN